ncbi:MAG: chromosome segregation protein [Syntrophorhabdus sp. PtaB.Bin006]|nr:MAG: chromosome segregation protein [Syntrophorhabdus sp. PtaB.Bin006]
MKLRYLKIKNYPPLNDITIRFSSDSLLTDRQCAIQFVVGVNGSGKTHLLQALMETFAALASQKPPRFPVTLVYDLGEGSQQRTLIFDHPGNTGNTGWWQSKKPRPSLSFSDYTEFQWLMLIKIAGSQNEEWEALIADGAWPGESVGLPRTILAYTTGDDTPWLDALKKEPSSDGINIISQSFEYETTIERPAGWSRKKEIEEQEKQPVAERTSNVQDLRKFEYESIENVRGQDIVLFLTPTYLKFALLCVTLPLAMRELKQHKTDDEIHTFIDGLKQPSEKSEGLRRLLTEIGWVWPVTASFSVNFQPDKWPQRLRQMIRPFFNAATTIIREPEPSTKRHLFFDLKHKSRNDSVGFTGDKLLNLLGGNDAHPFDTFKLLVDLHRRGLIDDLDLTLRKTEPDEILLFDELSDGEQMYLGRMGLFHLMQGHHDALLLLDEPETHFNDKWKREIVGIIDDVLKDTANDVLIATHSAITLTDVFNDEIILLENVDGSARRIDIASTTFGADPSEVMVRLFGVPDSVGKRAMEWLDQRIKDDYWKPEQKDELIELIKKVGPGFYRTELRAILKKLEKKNALSD